MAGSRHHRFLAAVTFLVMCVVGLETHMTAAHSSSGSGTAAHDHDHTQHTARRAMHAPSPLPSWPVLLAIGAGTFVVANILATVMSRLRLRRIQRKAEQLRGVSGPRVPVTLVTGTHNVPPALLCWRLDAV